MRRKATNDEFRHDTQMDFTSDLRQAVERAVAETDPSLSEEEANKIVHNKVSMIMDQNGWDLKGQEGVVDDYINDAFYDRYASNIKNSLKRLAQMAKEFSDEGETKLANDVRDVMTRFAQDYDSPQRTMSSIDFDLREGETLRDSNGEDIGVVTNIMRDRGGIDFEIHLTRDYNLLYQREGGAVNPEVEGEIFGAISKRIIEGDAYESNWNIDKKDTAPYLIVSVSPKSVSRDFYPV